MSVVAPVRDDRDIGTGVQAEVQHDTPDDVDVVARQHSKVIACLIGDTGG
jgi:hypothetical protein